LCSPGEVVDMWISCAGYVLMQMGLAVSILTSNRW